ncbi:MAG: lysophospholipid acyltransferase family protein [Desulfosarcinaceae bacterium]|nr:lysophospholipid acyltransferase family protein [Desulfosarcinaceae bacterium]
MRIPPEAGLGPAHHVGPLPPRIHHGLKTALRLLFAPFGGFRVVGADNIPRQGGFLLLPKHQRWVDIPYLGLACPRRLCYVAKVELFQAPLSRHIFTFLGGIPLDRRRPIATRHSLRAIRKTLQSGCGVVVFPEGTYVPGRMGDERSSLLRYLIRHVPVPLVPVGISYTVAVGRRTVILRFGAPQLPVNSDCSMTLSASIFDRIASLSGLDGRC